MLVNFLAPVTTMVRLKRIVHVCNTLPYLPSQQMYEQLIAALITLCVSNLRLFVEQLLWHLRKMPILR